MRPRILLPTVAVLAVLAPQVAIAEAPVATAQKYPSGEGRLVWG